VNILNAITKIHNNADARVEKPFSSSLVDYKSKGRVQVDSNNKNSYHKLSSDELHWDVTSKERFAVVRMSFSVSKNHTLTSSSVISESESL
jgi:hypothetical protein